MKTLDWFFLFVIVTVGVTLGNLVALKIAADQINSSVKQSPLAGLLGSLGSRA
jgi:hypothetical protein